MFILHTTFAPEAVFAIALLVGYGALAFLAHHSRPVLWGLAVLGAYIALIIVAAADKKIETTAELPARSAWVLLQAATLLILPCVGLTRSAFSSSEWLSRMGWLAMFAAASAVFAQTCVFRFNWGGWEVIRGLSQILFIASALAFVAIFVIELRSWRRQHKELGMFDEETYH